MNQQYILIKASLKQKYTESRLYIDWLMKILWPEVHEEPNLLPQEQWFSWLIRWVWWCCKMQLLWIMRVSSICCIPSSIYLCHLLFILWENIHENLSWYQVITTWCLEFPLMSFLPIIGSLTVALWFKALKWWFMK